MSYTRRDFAKVAVSSAVAGLAIPGAALALPNSKIDGVQIGAITYSFRQGVPKAELPAVMAKIGLSEVELMSGDAEAMAGAPVAAGGGGGRGRGAGGASGAALGAAGGSGVRRGGGGGGGRAPLT